MKFPFALSFAILPIQAFAAGELDCDIANRVQCAVKMEKSSIKINVHNSGRNYCGLEILSNQNFAYDQWDEFAEGIEASLGQGKPLSLRRGRNSLIITDISINPDGGLPFMFIVPIQIKTKSSESLEALADRTIGQHRFPQNGPTALSITAVNCKKKDL